MDLMERNGYILRVLRAPDGYRKVLYRDENRSDEVSAQIRLKNLVWAIFFSFREKEKMSLTEKTDIRDSDEKVVEIEMERLDKKKCSSQFTLSSDCIRRFCEKYREARIILISSWKNGFISSHNEKNTPQIKELEAQLDRYGIRIVGKVCDNRYRDYAVRDYLKEHPSIKEYVVVDDDIKEYSSKDIPHLRLVDSKVGFR